jgi:hypothetical protein
MIVRGRRKEKAKLAAIASEPLPGPTGDHDDDHDDDRAGDGPEA